MLPQASFPVANGGTYRLREAAATLRTEKIESPEPSLPLKTIPKTLPEGATYAPPQRK